MSDTKLEQAKETLADWAVNAGDHPAGGAACIVLDALAEAGRDLDARGHDLGILRIQHSTMRILARGHSMEVLQAKLINEQHEHALLIEGCCRVEDQRDALEAKLAEAESRIRCLREGEDNLIAGGEQLTARVVKLLESNLGLASALAESQGREVELRRRVAVLEDTLATAPELGIGWRDASPEPEESMSTTDRIIGPGHGLGGYEDDQYADDQGEPAEAKVMKLEEKLAVYRYERARLIDTARRHLADGNDARAELVRAEAELAKAQAEIARLKANRGWYTDPQAEARETKLREAVVRNTSHSCSPDPKAWCYPACPVCAALAASPEPEEESR